MYWSPALRPAGLVLLACLHVLSASPIATKPARTRILKRSLLDVLIGEESLPSATTGDLAFRRPENWNINLEIGEAANHEGVVLECSVDSTGASATIHWLFNGERIIQGRSDLSVFNQDTVFEAASASRDSRTNSRLFVGCLEADLLGEYTCVAETPTQRRAITRNITASAAFLEGRALSPCARDIPQPAKVYMYKESHSAVEGSTAQLFCRSTGSPAPQVAWFYLEGTIENVERRRLTTGDKYLILDNGDLVIKSLNSDNLFGDMGDYECHVENDFSRDHVTTNLYVYAPELEE